VGFEPTIPVFEWEKMVHGLYCAATVIGHYVIRSLENPVLPNSCSRQKTIVTQLHREGGHGYSTVSGCIEVHEVSRKKLHTVLNTLGFEVLREMIIKSTVFWDVKLCSLVEVYGRFGGTY
jgi:hypothetical protein